MATTLFNEESSRSHCIFTIYLIQMSNGKNTMTQMSFVDLAGSERMAKRTVNNTRLKESGNINKSLMTLKNCIATVRYNNTHKANQRIIPYRESKLTRLLQNYFVNRSLLTMIVNVSLDSSAFDETLHVLRFSAIASQVRIPAAVPDTTELSDSFEGGEDDDDDEEFEALIQEIEVITVKEPFKCLNNVCLLEFARREL
jgi:kinesin family protein 20